MLIEPSNAELAAKLGLQTRADKRVLRPHRRRQRSGRPHRRAVCRARGHRHAGDRARRRRRPGRRHRAARQLPRLPRGHQRRRVRRPSAPPGRALRRRDPLGAGGRSRRRRRRLPLVRTADGAEYRAWAVLLALRLHLPPPGIPGEEDFIGAGVHFCATCDGAFYRDKEVLVIGGGNSAGEEGIFLTRFAAKVTIVTRDKRALSQQGRGREGRREPQDRAVTNVDARPSSRGDEQAGHRRARSDTRPASERELTARRRLRLHRPVAEHRLRHGTWSTSTSAASSPTDAGLETSVARHLRGRRLPRRQHQAGRVRGRRGRRRGARHPPLRRTAGRRPPNLRSDGDRLSRIVWNQTQSPSPGRERGWGESAAPLNAKGGPARCVMHRAKPPST